MSEDPSRSYMLEDGESPPAGVERIVLGRIASALDELRGKGSETFAESVHLSLIHISEPTRPY